MGLSTARRALVMNMLGGGAAPVASFTVTTTGAVTLNLASLGVADGKTLTVNWGDGTNDDYTGTAARSHNYAGAGVWTVRMSPPAAIITFTANDSKIAVNTAAFRDATNITTFSLEFIGGTFNSADLAAWRPTTFFWRRATGIVAGTFNSADLAAWRPTTFAFFEISGSLSVTISAGGLAAWAGLSTLVMSNLGLNQAQVDQVLADLWAGFATRTATGGTINVGGSNAAPSGTLQAANPPTTGKEYAYELANDSQNINPTKKWTTVTITS